MSGRVIRIAGFAIVIIGLGALVIYSALQPANSDKTPWNQAMTLGDKDNAKHHFVMYTDIFCPYCDKFSDAVAANKDKFMHDYIERENILFEIRVTDMNYEAGHSNNSRPAGIAAYCAANQNNFWDYYYSLLKQMYDEYHSHGIGIDKYSAHIPDLELDFFYRAAEGTDLDKDKFKQCVANNETAKELDRNTARANRIITGGIPYFVFDKFTYDGFMGNWDTTNDYEQVKLLMDAGLSTK